MVLNMRIYVGNLSRKTTKADLRNLFATYGQIGRVGLAKEKPNGTWRGFGIVEMNQDSDGKRAIAALRGKLFGQRPLKVREALIRAKQNTSNGNNKS